MNDVDNYQKTAIDIGAPWDKKQPYGNYYYNVPEIRDLAKVKIEKVNYVDNIIEYNVTIIDTGEKFQIQRNYEGSGWMILSSEDDDYGGEMFVPTDSFETKSECLFWIRWRNGKLIVENNETTARKDYTIKKQFRGGYFVTYKGHEFEVYQQFPSRRWTATSKDWNNVLVDEIDNTKSGVIERAKYEIDNKSELKSLGKKLQFEDATDLKNALNIIKKLQYHNYNYLISNDSLIFKDDTELKDVKQLLDNYKIPNLVKNSDKMDISYQVGDKVKVVSPFLTVDGVIDGIDKIYITVVYKEGREKKKVRINKKDIGKEGMSLIKKQSSIYLPFNEIIKFRDYLVSYLGNKTLDVNINELSTLFDFKQIVDWLYKNSKKEIKIGKLVNQYFKKGKVNIKDNDNYILNTIEDVENLIFEKSKEYGGRNKFFSSNEYKTLYPKIEKIYLKEKDDYILKGEQALKESDIKIGDRVENLSSGFGEYNTITGTVILKSGIPYVKLDEAQMSPKGYRKQVKWNKGWKKINNKYIKNKMEKQSEIIKVKTEWVGDSESIKMNVEKQPYNAKAEIIKGTNGTIIEIDTRDNDRIEILSLVDRLPFHTEIIKEGMICVITVKGL